MRSSAVPRLDRLGADLLHDFEAWMKSQRGVRPATISAYRYPVSRLLDALGSAPAKVTAAALRTFIADHAKRHGGSYARRTVSASRMFLRFAAATGRCAPSLVDAIPTVACWKLSWLPRYLRPESIERAVAMCDPTLPAGLRDRAILLLGARIGLRADDLRKLTLDDLDFERAMLRVEGKGRQQVWLPLPQDVGDAVLAYLASGRPETDAREVFVRSRKPCRQYRSSSTLSRFVRDALRRAGITCHPCSAHTLRHSAAFRLLGEGASLEAIGTVLRHASIDTSFIYAKVDSQALGEIAQAWPGEVAAC